MKGHLMRSKLIALTFSFGLVAATAVPSLACSFNTQASSDTQQQQQTAQAQPQQPSQTSTQ